MKRIITTLLSLAAVLVLAPAALAAEEITIINSLPELFTQEDRQPGDTHLLSLEDSTWERSWTCYKDQLTGDALTYYEILETAVGDDTFVAANVTATDSSGQKVSVPCWTESLGTFEFTYEYVDSNSPQQAYNDWIQKAVENLSLACEALVLDHPEYFWIRYNHVAIPQAPKATKTKITVTLNVGFMQYRATDTTTEIEALQKDIDATVNELLKAVEGKTMLDKLQYMDNWLAEHNHYNMKAATNANWITEKDETPWSIVGGLLDDYSPVCEGYSKAFQLFCQKNNIPCLQVTGTANGGAHMWNYVQYAGEWYLCDTTWDDPLYKDKNGNLYDKDESSEVYFMISSAEEASADDSAKHTEGMDFLLPNLAAKKPSTSCVSGHTYNDWTEIKAPTCTELGEEARVCVICGHTEVREVAACHDYTSVITEPSCTEQGYTTYTCTRCGDSYMDNYVPETGEHTFEENICKDCGLIGGTCGVNLNWTLVDGVLSICGTGDMTDYGVFSDDAPWYNTYKDEIRKLVITDGVTSIGDRAFQKCVNLIEVQLPESITEIGFYSFGECSGLKELSLPDSLLTIGEYAFSECTSLESITIPDNVSTISWQAFRYCSGLKDVTLNNNLKSIESHAFAFCTNLVSVEIPANVTRIVGGAFACCTSLTEIIVDPQNTSFVAIDGILFNSDFSTLICYPAGKTESQYHIPANVTVIGVYAFSGSSVTNVDIPDGVTRIEGSAFYECRSLTRLTIPASVVWIDWFTFSNCTSLSTLTFEGDAPILVDYAFSALTTTIYYPCANETWTADVRKNYDGNVTWKGYGHTFSTYTADEECHCQIAYCDNGCGEADVKFEEEPTGAVEDNKIVWTEYSAGNVLVVLYDEHGRMIDMKYCEKTILKTAGSVEICRFTLDFSPEELASAHKILSFNFNEGWVPIRNFKSIS